MPAHYAISEALIVIAALYFGVRLWRRGQKLGAAALFVFGAAASIGVYRFPSGQVEQLAQFHRMAGLMAGVLGMALMSMQLIRLALPQGKKLKGAMVICTAALCVSLVLSWFDPARAVPIFLAWSLYGAGVAFAIPQPGLGRRFVFALGTAAMLLNVIFIRQSAAMGPDVSWHIYHTLIAVWLVVMYWIFTSKSVAV